MNKLTSILTAAAMSVGVMSAGTVPGYSAPFLPLSVESPSNIQRVDEDNRAGRPRYWPPANYHRGDGGYRGDRGYRANRGDGGYRSDRGYRGDRYRYDGYRGDRYRYNGHRGYRYYRPGYRYYNDAWFPLAAFGTGLIIGNAISQPAPVYRTGSSHAEWCFNRYRSYRAYDNTYQPYGGPRRQCISPYY